MPSPSSPRRRAAGGVAVLCEPHRRGSRRIGLAQSRYFVEADATVGKLVGALRADARLGDSTPLYLYSAHDERLLDAALPLRQIALPTAMVARGADAEDRDALRLLYTSLQPDELHASPWARALRSVTGWAWGGPAGGGAVAAPSPAMANPHGERLPEGASIAACTFLNPRASGALLPALHPSCGGAPPGALYAALLLDVTAVGLVVPLLAKYSRDLGGGPRFTGLLQATYGVTQLIGANLLGGLSDTVGRKRVLQASMLGGCAGYLALAAAVGPMRSSALLLISRLPIGLLKQSLAVSRALLVDCTTPATRLRAMTKLGAVVGAGFVFGPAFGGALSKKVGLAAPPLLAAALFAAALLTVTTSLPETAPTALASHELDELLAKQRRRWDMLTRAQPPPASLPLDSVILALPDLLLEWRPRGEALGADDARRLRDEWAALLRDAAGSGRVRYGMLRVALVDVYLRHAQEAGLLHGAGAKHVRAQLWAADAPAGAAPPVVAGGAAARGAGPWAASAYLRELLREPSLAPVRSLLCARAVVDCGVMLMHAVFADYTRAKFGWDQKVRRLACTPQPRRWPGRLCAAPHSPATCARGRRRPGTRWPTLVSSRSSATSSSSPRSNATVNSPNSSPPSAALSSAVSASSACRSPARRGDSPRGCPCSRSAPRHSNRRRTRSLRTPRGETRLGSSRAAPTRWRRCAA